MRKIRPDLWETEPEHPAPGLSTHAYLWTPPAGGNVLFYNTTHAHELDHMAELGGVAHQYLSHQDEIAPSLSVIHERFGARLHSHRAEAELVEKVAPVAVPFDRRYVDDVGVHVIPAPGHTPGSAFYQVTSDRGETYLFTGDSIYLSRKGTWTAGYIPDFSDRDSLAASLAGVAHLTPDTVISSAFVGDSGVTELAGRPWADCVQEALAALQNSLLEH